MKASEKQNAGVTRMRNRDLMRARRAEALGDYTLCPVTGHFVAMPADGRCPWCHTDHSYRSRLTARQLETMRLLGQGKLRKEIAVDLGVSEHVIANEWREVRQKLLARTTAHALAMLVREGSA